VHLLHAKSIEKSFGDRTVLRGADLAVASGDRIGLVGVNGSGKSTLLKILSGAQEADHGDIVRRGTWALLGQHSDLPGRTVQDALEDAVSWHHALVAGYEAALDSGDMTRAGELQGRLDQEGWTIGHRIESLSNQLGAPDGDAVIARLSGGERRRVALARVLLQQPELLMLDEPTNHLDADTCEWLQGLLTSWRGAVVLVTHDRYLLEATATHIVEVNDGLSVSYDGSYADYLIARVERQARLERADDKRLALISQEAEWASRSPAARSTKQKARLLRLDALQEVRPIKREEQFRLNLRTGKDRGGPLIELTGICKAFGSNKVLDNVDLVVRAGETVGVIGPNGAGKSTLLNVLRGTLEPDKGTVQRAPRQHVAVLDQQRTGLDLDATVFEAAGGGNDHVFIGERAIHVASFLDSFQFPRESFDQKARSLSGGERARLLLAKLMLQGANVLLLDEPTNDLDLLTLGILEAALIDFNGAAVVVTHDRAFLDRTCDSVLAFAGEGKVEAYASRLQHLAHMDALRAEAKREKAAAPKAKSAPARPSRPKPRKKGLSFREQREHSELPDRIEAKEAELEAVTQQLGDPATYQAGAELVATLSGQAEALPVEIEGMYARWEELEART
jgi:ABC transport system ATP-binding/permease protein